MKNNGQITVFLSLVLVSLLGLFLAAVEITGIRSCPWCIPPYTGRVPVPDI